MAVLTGFGRRVTGVVSAALLVTGVLVSVGSGVAVADTQPVDPTEPLTVSADVLPTAQINGVAWKQVIVGNTVYVGGKFTSARPAGVSAGTQESARSNLLAYNLTTGALITTFAPTVNGQILGMTVSPDASRLYIVGEFTSVNGQTRNRIAAFNLATGALDSNFHPSLSFRARAVVATNTTVYAGGAFTSVGSQTRTGLASFLASTGALQSWAPEATGGQVYDMVMSPDGSKIVVAGGFDTLGGQPNRGMGAVAVSDGTVLPWAANQIIQNYGPDSAIYSLTSDGTNVYGTGYDYFGPSDFENVFAASWQDGSITWVNGCLGDTYGVAVVGPVVYAAGHPHNCSAVGGNPEVTPRTTQRAQAMTVAVGGTNSQGTFTGRPSSQLLQWLPTISAGTFTGQSQGAWAVAANSQYVVLGGEFPRINSTNTQGLARFAVRTIAPNREGPQDTNEMYPNLTSLAPGTVRVSWKSAWDRDNKNLTYEVLRGSTVIATVTGDSQWWNRPTLAFTDRTAPTGTTQNYRIRVRDAFANTVTTPNVPFTVPAGTAAPSPYGDQVVADGATNWWRLSEDGGSTVGYDYVGADDLVVDPSSTRAVGGALNESNAATSFPGTATVPASTTNLVPGPDTFSVEAWFNTTTTRGGKIIGFGNSSTDRSSAYDRHVFMDDAGRLVFGAYPNAERRITSSAAYNDGQWHHVVATLGADGMNLIVDGRRVARRTDTTSGQAYSGYWKIGGDNTWGSSSPSFAGSIDEVAVYPTQLTVPQAIAHYNASGRTANVGTRPADAYGAAVFDAEPYSYWRLNEPAGTTTVADTGADARTGTLFNGTTLGVTGAVAPATGANGAAHFDGSDDVIATSAAIDNPTVYSTELWFRTTTTRGGKLIGFGRAQSGTSGSYDRHVWMLNDGRLVFGTYNGNLNTVEGPQSYNNGQWHHVVASQGSDGMKLYVDGQLVGSNPNTQAEGYTGYWRLGGDQVWYGADSNYFDGDLDEAAVYPTVLTPAQVLDHWTKGQAQSANAAPTASFTSSSSALTASFDGTGSADPDGSIASYAWNFGDGSAGTGATPTHVYATAGTYTVSLLVTDNRGGTNTATQQVVISPPPNVAPVAAFTSTTTGLTVSADASISTDADGTVAGYLWDFGDGSPISSGVSVSHGYVLPGTYNVTLTVTDDEGATDTETSTITVQAPPPANVPPSASFTSTSTDLTVSVDASASTDTDGTVTGYSWNFGDGGTGMGATISHPYAAAGSYQVTLTVTDDDGAIGTDVRTVTVTAPPVPNTPPTASFTSTPVDLAAAFDGTGSSDADGTVQSWAWNFGDGGTATGATTSHAYAATGTYDVTLTVTDDDGATGVVSHQVSVTAPVPNAAPTAAFSSTTSALTASFDGTGSTDADGTIVSSAWNFGDGTTGTGATTSHPYATTGTYTVVLTVTDDDGATGTVSHTVSVTAPTGPTQVASDSFGRTATGGFGTADVGGAWTPVASAANFGVSGGQGRITLPSAGARRTIQLAGVQRTDADVTALVSLDKVQTGGGSYVSVVGRRVGTAEYRARLKYSVGGTVGLSLTRSVNGTETVLATTALSGTVSLNEQLAVRIQVSGASPTTVSARVWRVGTAEPTAWQVTTTDSTTVLQAAGSVGFDGYVSGSTTNAPLTVSVDDLRVTSVGGGTPPPANVAPAASFTVGSAGLTASFDASASSDPDGTIAGYSWVFGDGATGTGVTTSHVYAAGTYTATLTVTDNAGGTGTTTRPVTVTAPPAGTTLASDAFGRTVVSGWGTADSGGAWTLTGGTTSFSVAGGTGRATAPVAGKRTAVLSGVTATSTDLTASFSLGATATGGGTYVSFVGRSTSAGDYRARVRVQPSGVPSLQLMRVVGTTESVLTQVNLTGVTAGAGQVVRVRLQVEGSGTTTLRARAWSGATEPTTWAVTTSDATAALQGAGAPGLGVYVSGSSTEASAVSFDDLVVRPVTAG